jgi:hypothetical protein
MVVHVVIGGRARGALTSPQWGKATRIGTLFAFILVAIGFIVYFAYGVRHSRLVTDPTYSRDADAAAREGRRS